MAGTMKTALIDVGELGWSLYLSAHARHLVQKGEQVIILTYPERVPLYPFVNEVVLIPDICNLPKQCLGFYGSDRKALREKFKAILPDDAALPEWFEFDCLWNFQDKAVYEPYPVVDEEAGPRILLFPRCREHSAFSMRNLPRSFWVALAVALVKEFPEAIITAVGTKEGAYYLNEMDGVGNFDNRVGTSRSIQAVIDLCEAAMGAVGSASSLPKLSMNQRVPTFVVGHERERVKKENFAGARLGFYDVGIDSYERIDSDDCISKIIRFLNGENVS